MAALPTPRSTFTIPSLHDDLEIDCRIYYPRSSEKTTIALGRTFAVIAHPYAPLGGSFDDPVVALTGAVLLKHGVTLGTFNFRGAHGSAGRTSWSGKAELGDYVAFYVFMLYYMNYVRAELNQKDDETANSQSVSRLILGGYSYGSLIASCLPALELLSPLFQEAKQGSAESEIKQRAEQMGTDLVAYIEMQKNGSLGRGRSDKQAPSATSSPSHGIAMGGCSSEAAARRVSRDSSRRSLDKERFRKSVDRTRQRLVTRTKSDQEIHTTSTPEEHPAAMMLKVDVAFLLISPILPPVAQFTTMFTKPTFERKDPLTQKTIAKDTSPRDEKFAVSPTCLIYGNKDLFTSSSRTQKWVRRLSSRPGANIKYHEVNGAGHFWTEPDAPQQLQASVGSWLAELGQDRSRQR